MFQKSHHFPTKPDPSSQKKWRTPREVLESRKVGITPPWQRTGSFGKGLPPIEDIITTMEPPKPTCLVGFCGKSRGF